jgi:hypothetical protein
MPLDDLPSTMTIAIGINFGAYILLAADTRTTYYNPNGGVISYEDDSVKIQKTSMGLITGAGSTELLDRVKKRLKEEEIRNTNQVLSIIREQRRLYQHLSGLEQRIIENTGWIFSYLKPVDGNYTLRLATYHPRLGDGIGLFAEHDPAVIFPQEATEEVAKPIGDFLKESIRPFEQFGSLGDSLQYHWSKIVALIRAIRPRCNSISSFLQIGVHTAEHLTGISPIVKDTDDIVSLDLTAGI